MRLSFSLIFILACTLKAAILPQTPAQPVSQNDIISYALGSGQTSGPQRSESTPKLDSTVSKPIPKKPDTSAKLPVIEESSFCYKNGYWGSEIDPRLASLDAFDDERTTPESPVPRDWLVRERLRYAADTRAARLAKLKTLRFHSLSHFRVQDALLHEVLDSDPAQWL